MDQRILVTEEINAGSELIQRLNTTLPIQAAFWLKDAYEGQWYLYLASDQVTGGMIGEGYGKVIEAYNQKRDVYLDLLQVKLISLDDPLAKEALDTYERYPWYAPRFLRGGSFGGMSIEGGVSLPPIHHGPRLLADLLTARPTEALAPAGGRSPGMIA